MTDKKRTSAKSDGIFLKILLLILSVSLFWLSNPNIIFENGLSFLAWIIYLPVLILIKKSKISQVIIFGAVYGSLSYGLYGYWLNSFHPLGLIIVCIGYFIICVVFFGVLKWADLVCSKNTWLLQFFCICAYEYIKTLGYFGINYGVTAYTQWNNTLLIQICSIAGVFGFNLLVIFPSVFLFSFITKTLEKRRLLDSMDNTRKSHISAYVKKEQQLSIASLKLTYICGGIWLILMLAAVLYGTRALKRPLQNEYVTVAAIQNNESPWKDGIEEYSQNVGNLIQLTEEALSLSSEIDFVVWPETAVAPSIIYNYDYGTDVRRFMLVSQILNFIDENNVVFVIGNAHDVELRGGEKVRYNSSLVFESGKNVHPPKPEIYSKMKLVPFTESFPWKNTFPSLYVKLLNGNTHMWETGDDYTVFDYRGLKFSTPICFEDTFSTICRRMVLNGSRCFINLSNDSWSKSRVCQKQHLAMAVFRSVENGVPSVRSTASGVTCIINQNGKIQKAAPDFCQAYIIGKIPVLSDYEPTFYTKTGDIAGMLAFGVSATILIIQTIIVIIKKIRK